MGNEVLDAAEKMISSEGALSSRLTHDETLRGSALALACNYYVNTIVKDGELYREMVRDNRVLKPATYMGVLEVAMSFEAFLRGDLEETADSVVEDPPEGSATEGPSAEVR